MARRRRPRSPAATRAITVAPRAAPSAAPIVIRTPAAPIPARRGRGSVARRRLARSGGGGSQVPSLAASAAAGGVIGLLKGSGLLEKIPRLPLIGRIGGLALAAHFWADHSGSRLARDVSRAAVALAAYQLASSDKPLAERIDGFAAEDELITV